MLLSAVSVLVVAQSSSEIPEGLMNNPVFVKMGIYLPGADVIKTYPQALGMIMLNPSKIQQ